MLQELVPPGAANRAHAGRAEDQPMTWELPPQLQGLGGFWADDSTREARLAA